MMKLEAKGKGHFEVQFEDGMTGIAAYEKSLDELVKLLATLDRKAKTIEWVED